jgi:hypothetical protein
VGSNPAAPTIFSDQGEQGQGVQEAAEGSFFYAYAG